MPINIQKVEQEIERENEELKKKLIDLGTLKDVTDTNKALGALIAINMATYQRLGDMISFNLRTR